MPSRDTDPCLRPESESPDPGGFASEKPLEEIGRDLFCREQTHRMADAGRLSEAGDMTKHAERALLQIVAAKLASFESTLGRVELRSEEMADWRIAHDAEHQRLISRLGGLEQHRAERALFPAILAGGAMAVAIVALVASAWLAGRLGIGYALASDELASLASLGTL